MLSGKSRVSGLDRRARLSMAIPACRAKSSTSRRSAVENSAASTTTPAQCQQVRAVSPARIVEIRGNVGPTVLIQVRETIAVIKLSNFLSAAELQFSWK